MIFPSSGYDFEVKEVRSDGTNSTVFINIIEPVSQHVLHFYTRSIDRVMISEEFGTDQISVIDQYGICRAAKLFWMGSLYDSSCDNIETLLESQILLFKEKEDLIVNTSTRGQIMPSLPLISGFVITQPAIVIVRGLGPSLPAEINPIQNPRITIHGKNIISEKYASNGGTIYQRVFDVKNDDWKDSDSLTRYNLAYFDFEPEYDTESAFIIYLTKGLYSVHLHSEESGQGLVEVFTIPYIAHDFGD